MKRHLFAELAEGFAALKREREEMDYEQIAKRLRLYAQNKGNKVMKADLVEAADAIMALRDIERMLKIKFESAQATISELRQDIDRSVATSAQLATELDSAYAAHGIKNQKRECQFSCAPSSSCTNGCNRN